MALKCRRGSEATPAPSAKQVGAATPFEAQQLQTIDSEGGASGEWSGMVELRLSRRSSRETVTPVLSRGNSREAVLLRQTRASSREGCLSKGPADA